MVSLNLLDLIAALKRELRDELAELETTSEHHLQAEQRRRETLEALHRKRHGQVLAHARALRQGDERLPTPDVSSPTGWRLGPTGDEQAAEIAGRIALIDAEINRLSREAEA